MNNVVDPVRVQASLYKYFHEVQARVENLKARTNLIPNEEYTLRGAATRKGFLGVMQNAYRQQPIALFAGFAMLSLDPLVFDEDPGLFTFVNDRKNRTFYRKLAVDLFEPGGYARIRRDEQGFIVKIPYLKGLAPTVAKLWGPKTPSLSGGISGRIDHKMLIKKGCADARAQDLFASCLVGAYVEHFEEEGLSAARFILEFRITKTEAQHMTNKSWASIRNIDIYPLIELWGNNGMGMFGRSPIQSHSVGSIARGLPKDPKVLTIKVNDQQITCERQGRPLFIPRECDNTSRYEDLVMQAGSKDDGFGLLDSEGLSDYMPRNMPVLVDWLNCKFSYTDGRGQMKVRNLMNCRPATPTHISTWLKKNINDTSLKRVLNVVDASSDEAFGPRPSDFSTGVIPDELNTTNVLKYVTACAAAMYRKEQRFLQWGDVAYNSHYEFMRPLGRFFRAAARQILSNLEPAFNRYTVEHITSVLPWIIICAHYAPMRAQVEAEAAALNSAAANQEGNIDYDPEAPALWNGECGLQPHQRRIASLLKDSPPFAILPVPAGGGKTPSIVFDVLQQFGRGIGNPYLILCPGHLVAQYVKEINFFTRGRLNVIPIVTRVYNINGIERLTDVIRNAPRNTVVVCNYDALSVKAVSICYGTTNVNIYPIADMLRQFSFGYCALDESHWVKNQGAAKTEATMSLIADIPMKRLASGTMAHDSPSDLASQIAMLDPTLFGSVEDFNERFGEEVKGSRVISWKPGYENEFNRALKERVVVCRAHRKEWAALLPPADEQIIPVALTEAQRLVYEGILHETLVEIRKDPKLLKAMDDQKASIEDEDESDTDLSSMLQPYLSRLETFVNAPDKDVIGNKVLRGPDRISPKMAVINEQIREHFAENRPGKILIFTNHHATAEHIYENLEPQFRKVAIPYLASNKVEDGAEFEKNPNKRILVGVEKSLNTGLNLQHASMLIRCETVWNPGALEQGNSRINRPSLKVEDNRDAIYYRWIVCDRTVDVTKMSRLTAKIVAVAKFENPNNPEYRQLPDLDIIPLSLDTIATENTWNGTLRPYGVGYRDYKQLTEAEYAEYREKYIAKYGKNFMKFFGDGGVTEDATLADGIPWVPGLEIAAEQELNLIRIDQYLRADDTDSDDDDDDSDTEGQADLERRKEIIAKLKGQKVFCEYGEGIIEGVGVGLGIVLVRIGNKRYKGIKWAAAFIQGKPLTKPVRFNQSRFTGMPVEKITDIDPANKVVTVQKTAKELREEQKKLKKTKMEKVQKKAEDLRATINMVSTNGFLGLRLEKEAHTPELLDVLQAQGFRPDVPTRRARMKTAKMLNDQMWLWVDKGFSISQEMDDEGTLGAFEQMMELLKTRQIKQDRMVFNLVTKQKLRNFHRVEMRPTKERKELKIYPVIEDGYAYIYAALRGQAGNRSAMRHKAPGVIWEETPDTVSWYCTRPAQIKTMLKRLVGVGVKLTNADQLEKQYAKLRKAKARKVVVEHDVDE